MTAFKLAKSIVGRRRAARSWRGWLEEADLQPVRLWVHAPSVGEGLVADPVLERLHEANEGAQTVIKTYTSPSAARWESGFRYDRMDFLPSRGALAHLFSRFRPTMILYPRADLWPSLVARASAYGVPQVIIGGSLRPRSRRLRWPGHLITRRMIHAISAIGVVCEDDRAAWELLGASPSKIVVTGDPRDTQVLEAIPHLRDLPTISQWARNGFLLVAGSTHRGDEEPVIEAAGAIACRAVIVPHEPTTTAVRRIGWACRRRGLVCAVVSDRNDEPDPAATVLVVSVKGILRDLYPLASVVLVGGGFDGDRVHSCSEPAAVGVPILTGPGGEDDPQVRRFLASGGARTVRNAREIVVACRGWTEPAVRQRDGSRARNVLAAAAAAKTVSLIREVTASAKPQRSS